MTTENNEAAPDLDFLRSLVDGTGGKAQKYTGQTFVVGGGLYAFQCFAIWLVLMFRIGWPAWLSIGVNVLPTVLFLLWCVWLGVKTGSRNTGSTTSRAVMAAFQASGLANLALIGIFAPAAYIRQDFTIWLFYPAVVSALQGAAWLTAFQLRKRVWLLAVALGWLISAVLLGALIGTVTYLLVCGLALTLFMVLPGVAMVKLADKHG